MVHDPRSHVVITGMHRSGTSFLSRALNLSGVDLGPASQYYDTEIKPNIGNPKGHWENIKINKLNDEILHVNNGTWDNVPENLNKIPPNFETKVNEILNEFHSYRSLAYGFKDPRFCLTAEKWIPYMSNCVLVGIFRHPLKVAESLKIRNNFDYNKSLGLWKIHNKKLLAYIKQYGGFLIDFDWPTKKLLDETTKICQKLGLSKINFESWFSAELKKSDKSFDSTFQLSKNILNLYDELRQLSEKNSIVNYVPIKFNTYDYEKILHDTILNSNSFYEKTVKLALNEIKNLKEERQNLFKKDPIGVLLSIFYTRQDLQKAFSEVYQGNYKNLIKWSQDLVQGKLPQEEISQEIFTFKKLLLDENLLNLGTENFQHDITQLNQTTELLKTHLSQQQIFTTKLQDENSKILDQLSQQQIFTTKLQDENSKILDQLSKTNNDNESLKNELLKNQNFIIKLQEENDKSKKILSDIQSSFGFKIMRFYGSNLDKMHKKKTLENTKQIISTSVDVIKSEGIKSYLHHVNQKIKQKEFNILSEHMKIEPITISSKPFSDEIPIFAKTYEPKFNISVVIPTNSSAEAIKPLIYNILSQVGLKNIEIILVNSGTFNLDTLASPKIKIISVNPKEFNHGLSRNLGAQSSTGEYIVFITDDAIPVSNHLFYELCESIQQDPKIVVSTGRQIPKSDSDLIYQFLLANHYKFLQLTKNQITFTDNFESLSPTGKRKISQIDDVCSCYKADVFLKYQYKKIQYAEDLDLGLRLVKDGFKIVQLSSTGVIHSHNRPAIYYVKRGVIDTIMISRLLGNTSDYSSFNLDLNTLLDHIHSAHSSLKMAIKRLNLDKTKSIHDTIENLLTYFQNIQNLKTNESNTELDELISKISTKEHEIVYSNNVVYQPFVYTMNEFERYLSQSFKNMTNLEDEFLNATYQLFGWTIGNIIGAYLVSIKNDNQDYEQAKKMEKFLISEV